MLNPTTVMAEALGNHLEDCYRKIFGPEEPTYPGKLNLSARMALDLASPTAACDPKKTPLASSSSSY